MNTQKKFKTYARFDKSGNIVPGSIIQRKNYPKVGEWREISSLEKSLTNPNRFNVIADWESVGVTDEDSFKTFLISGNDGDGNTNNLSNVSISNFKYTLQAIGRAEIICDLTATANLGYGIYPLYLSNMNVILVREIGKIKDLDSLYFYNNVISTLDCSNLQYIKYLDLSNNQILCFENIINIPKNLIMLTLDNNNISVFDPLVLLPNSLDNLSLINCNLNYFNPTLPLPFLTYLSLSDNNLSEFIITPEMSNLKDLELKNNAISTIYDINNYLTKVTNLYLNNNNISLLDSSFILPSNLKTLYLKGNNISYIDASFVIPDSLIALDFENCQFTTAGYTASEDWATSLNVVYRSSISFEQNLNSILGTNLKTILLNKGWQDIYN